MNSPPYNWVIAIAVVGALVASALAFVVLTDGDQTDSTPGASSIESTPGGLRDPPTSLRIPDPSQLTEGSGPVAPENTTPVVAGSFKSVANRELSAQGLTLAEACDSSDPVQKRMLKDYGAIFVARGVVHPPTCAFKDESEVATFTSKVPTRTETVNGTSIRLQTPAMNALLRANEATRGRITPSGTDSAARTFAAAVDNWNSRVQPGLAHWKSAGRITSAQATEIGSLPPPAQVAPILGLEAQGLWFSTHNDKTILASVAPPGASQHISMLALDVTQHEDAGVRSALAAEGWHQTVTNDLPHFTYLGVPAEKLPGLGLRPVPVGNRTFWVPTSR